MDLDLWQLRLLRSLADGGTVGVREDSPAPHVDALLASGLIAAVRWGRASTEFAITDAGRRALAGRLPPVD